MRRIQSFLVQSCCLYGLAVDARGHIYVGEVSYTEYPRLFPDDKIPWRMRSLQKLQKLE